MTLRVPSIDVEARVIRLGLEPNRELEVPTDYDEAGIWAGGPQPGEEGAAVIAGHIDSRETGPAVFYRLDELSAGDRIEIVDESGTRTEFTVDHLEEHPKDDFPTQAVYGWTPEPELRLITCSGDFDTRSGHYVDNTIVFASESRGA